MIKEYGESPFCRAAQTFAEALPRRADVSDEDMVNVVISGWRYDEIAESVLAMYEKVDVRVMPLPVFDIANALNYCPIPYRAYGSRLHDVLLAASPDAFTMQFRGSNKSVILYNDRMIPTRINYSIMHEIGHNELGHLEPSPLAEKEANYFAGLALCPLDLLERYGIDNARTIAQLFNVSEEFAVNRLRSVLNRRHRPINGAGIRFRDAVVSRFHFKDAYQMDLFSGTRNRDQDSA